MLSLLNDLMNMLSLVNGLNCLSLLKTNIRKYEGIIKQKMTNPLDDKDTSCISGFGGGGV